MWFVKKTVKEQIDKAVNSAKLRWEAEKQEEINQYRRIWEKAKNTEIQDLKKYHEDALQEKDKIIAKLYKRIQNQKKSFQKFKDLAIQNEILSTELSTESEAFLQLASRVVSSFSLLQFRAESINKKIEKKESKDIILKNIDIDIVETDLSSEQRDRLKKVNNSYS